MDTKILIAALYDLIFAQSDYRFFLRNHHAISKELQESVDSSVAIFSKILDEYIDQRITEKMSKLLPTP